MYECLNHYFLLNAFSKDFFLNNKKYLLLLCFLYFLFILKLYSEVISQQQSIMTHLAKQLSAEEIKLLIVSRVHMKSATTMPNPSNVLNFILRVQEYASHVLICVGAASVRDTEQYIQSAEALLEKFADKDKFLNHTQVTFLPVFPWGYFTTPLNAAVQFAQDKGFKYIVFQVYARNFILYYIQAIQHHLNYFTCIILCISP